MGKELVATSKLLAEAKALAAKSEDYLIQAGIKALEARASAGWEGGALPLAYKAELKKAGIGVSTERGWVQRAKMPATVQEHREKDAERKREERARTSERENVSETKKLATANPSRPPVPMAGEIPEAVRGMKAMMRRCKNAKTGAEKLKHRRVAFQYFKFLLEQSNLPAKMGMSADEIVDLIWII